VNSDATVYVVDDDPGSLRSTRWLLESVGLSVETYSSAREFLAAYDPGRPGCLLLDLRMPEMDGLDLQKELASRGAHPPIIFVTGYGDVPKCAEAMKTGAIDFLEKPADDKKILSLVRLAMEEGRRRRFAEASSPEITVRIQRLTPREREVMKLLYAGEAMKAIAAKLGISVQTVAKHRTRVLEKMEVSGEAELARILAAHQPEGL